MKFARVVFNECSRKWQVQLGPRRDDEKFYCSGPNYAELVANAINKSLARELKAATLKHEEKEKFLGAMPAFRDAKKKRVVGRRVVPRMAAARKARAIKEMARLMTADDFGTWYD